MFYKGIRIHYKIPTLGQFSKNAGTLPNAGTISKAAFLEITQSVRVESENVYESRASAIIVSVDRGNRRFFLEFASSDEFERWYMTLAPEEKTMNEVIMSDARKLIIDIDDPDDYELANQLSFYDFEAHVTSRIREVFMILGIGDPHIIIYDMCDDFKISYHAVVTNFTFSARTCKGLCMIICSNQIWDKCVDVGVYKTIQSVRIEGSTKYGQRRWKNRTNNHHLPFASGLLSNNDNTTESYFTCNVFTSSTTLIHTELRLDSPNPRVGMCCFPNADLSQFKRGKIRNNILPLYRVKPGFCIQCNRIHDRENAAIKYGVGRARVPVFICWRKYAQNN